jgi:hypothetical protein
MTTATTAFTAAHVVAAARRVYNSHDARVMLGPVTLAVEGGRYRMRGPQGTHSIAAEAEVTSLVRLVAHLSGFVGVEMLDPEVALREHPAAGEAPTPAPASTTRRTVPRRGPGGIVYTPAKGDEAAQITLPFGRGRASLEAVLACEELAFPGYELTPAQLRWLDRVVDEAMGNEVLRF